MENKSGSFVSGAALLMVAGLIVKFIGAVYRIPLNNIVGPEGMGYYDVVYRYYGVLVVISTSGFPTAISKMVSERVTQGDYRGARAVFRVSFRLLLGFGIATTLLMFLGAGSLSALTYADATGEIAKQALSFRALAPSLFFVSILCAYRGYLQGLQRMGGTAASQLVEQLGRLLVGFTLAFALLPRGPEYAAMGALIGISASELLGLATIYVFYFRHKPTLTLQIAHQPKSKAKYSFGSLSGQLLSIVIPVTIGASIMPLTNLMDTAMIIRTLSGIGYTTEAAREAYSLLSSFVNPIINMPAVLTVALAMSLVPAIAALMAAKDYLHVRNASRTGIKLALVISTPCAVGLYVLARPILGMLYGVLTPQQLDVAAGLMQTACVGVIFLSLVQTVTAMIQGIGKPLVPVINLAFGGILKIIIMLVLVRIPHINIQGAAVSTVACYAAACLLDVIYLVRKTSVKLNVLDVFVKPVFSSVAMGVVVYFLYGSLSALELNKYVSTLGAVGAGVLLYIALFFLLRMFNEDDLAFIPGGKKLERLFSRK